MTVQHVHVAEGGQAIVGNVNAPTEGVRASLTCSGANCLRPTKRRDPIDRWNRGKKPCRRSREGQRQSFLRTTHRS